MADTCSESMVINQNFEKNLHGGEKFYCDTFCLERKMQAEKNLFCRVLQETQCEGNIYMFSHNIPNIFYLLTYTYA